MDATRIALVTGANQGVGSQVAKELVANGPTVLLGSRNVERGEVAAGEIGPGAVAVQLESRPAGSRPCLSSHRLAPKPRRDEHQPETKRGERIGRIRCHR